VVPDIITTEPKHRPCLSFPGWMDDDDVGSTAMGKPRVNFDVPAVDPYYRVSWENPQMVTRYQRILEDPPSLRAFTEELKKIILRSRRASPDLCGARWQQS
jgi:hypothetical protein